MGLKGRSVSLFLISVTAALFSTASAAQCAFSGLNDHYLTSDASVPLSGSAENGVFIGPGIEGNRFDPSAAGPGRHTIIYADTSEYNVSRFGFFAPLTAGSGWTTVPASTGGALQDADNGLSPPIDIGFTFNFFGNSYTRLYVFSNGNVSFTPYNTDNWNTTRIPESAPPNNMIALARTDLKSDEPVRSEIKYRIEGRAPNRVFILDYEYFDPRGSNSEDAVAELSTQLKLFEVKQSIEIHTTELSSRGDWDWDDWDDDDRDDEDRDDDDGRGDNDRENDRIWVRALQGIENHGGTQAYYLPGRNNERWWAFADFVSFTAACTSSQMVTVEGGYVLHGTVEGLAEGNQIVLLNNGGDALTITRNGAFAFSEPMEEGDFYDVMVQAQPVSSAQVCTVANGSGTARGQVEDVSVTCRSETYDLTYYAGANGRIVGSSQQTVDEGGDGTGVTAMPDDGYRFSAWSDGVTANPRQDTDVTVDVVVTAEFVAQPDGEPQVDTTPPAFDSLNALNVNATALITGLPELTPPSAVDDTDTALEPTLATGQALFRPGAHELTWRVEDAAGNSAEATQPLHVHPLISLGLDKEAAEGGQTQIHFLLNGPAPVYPLQVGYRVAGTAGSSDHDLASGTVTFQEDELEKAVTVNIVQDDTPDAMEMLVVSLDGATTTEGAANFGSRREQTITLVEHNLAPVVELVFLQDERRTRLLAHDGGPVTVVAQVSDPNRGDNHAYAWVFPEGVTVTDVDEKTKTLDPASLQEGLQHVEVTVTEQGSTPLSASDREAVLVADALPPLNSNTDSDGDAIPDAEEGSADAGGDGQPDYLDPLEQTNVVSEHASEGYRFMVEADPGVRLELGDYALEDGMDGVRVSPRRLEGDTAATVGSDEVEGSGTYVDFQMRKLPLGASARVVIPQRQPVPEGATYRKYVNGVWTTFAEGPDDRVASAPGAEGVCPPPGSAEYTPGLAGGDWCVELTLSDGGPNDSDGEANGVIKDPGGIGGNSSSFTTGGGGATGWAGLLMLAALAFWRCLRLTGWPLSVMLVALATSARLHAAELITGFHPLYVSASAGYASTKLSDGDVEQRFANQGYTVDAVSSDGSRYAWSVGIGYRATDRFSLELGYLDLGDVNFTFESQSPGGGVAGIHPDSGHGGTLSGVYRHPLTDRLGLDARIGAFVWEGDFTTSQNGALVNATEGRNHALYYGLGVDYILSPEWSVGGEVQRFEFDHDPTHVLSLGVQFRFLEWFNRAY